MSAKAVRWVPLERDRCTLYEINKSMFMFMFMFIQTALAVMTGGVATSSLYTILHLIRQMKYVVMWLRVLLMNINININIDLLISYKVHRSLSKGTHLTAFALIVYGR